MAIDGAAAQIVWHHPQRMNAPRYPAPLLPGSCIAVTAPSSGVPAPLHRRLDLVLDHLRSQGFEVIEGQCLRQHLGSASAPAAQRAAELMHFLRRDDIAAIIPPWGGELAIELLDRLDWAALQQARPKWLLGYSDTSTLLLPLTLRLGWATAHGPGLMDLAPGQTDPLTCGLMAHLTTPAGGTVQQGQSSHWQLKWTDFADQPDVVYTLSEPTRWWCLQGHHEVRCSGRLIGGCIDTLLHLAGTVHAPVPAFIAQSANEASRSAATLLYLENSDLSPTGLVRALHGLRWAGWLQGLAGLLIGRSAAPDSTGEDELRYESALRSCLSDLPCPVLVDMDIGHRPPQFFLVNGAWAELRWRAEGGGELTQHFN